MSKTKKFFSLIHRDDVEISPETKVISAEAYSELLNAQELLKKAKEDAKQYRKEAEKECEELKDQAVKEGFEEGLKRWAEQISYLEKEIENVNKEITKLAVPLALKAAKKIIGREIEQSEKTIVDIVKNHLKAIAHHKKIKIFVGKADYNILDKEKENLKKLFEALESLSIVEREDVEPGGCIIETEGGIINAQLENQWEVLERAFESFLLSGGK